MTAKTPPAPGLVIMPVVDGLDYTLPALYDSLSQLNGQVQILILNQGSSQATRDGLEAELRRNPRLLLVTHDPPLPSLAASWNQTLDYAWACGFQDALVVNNDVRMGSWLYQRLRDAASLHGLWWVSPVNVRDQEGQVWELPPPPPEAPDYSPLTLGGPDFSCFLITEECHVAYRFDERFQPAYFEDNDYHRRHWLGGDGAKIAGVTLPYLHYGGSTIKQNPARAEGWEKKFEAVRARYVQKWGGLPHHERYLVPVDAVDFDGLEYDEVGTPGGYLSMEAPSASGRVAANVATIEIGCEDTSA